MASLVKEDKEESSSTNGDQDKTSKKKESLQDRKKQKSTEWKKNKNEAGDAKRPTKEKDFGAGGDWMAVDNKCINRTLHSYEYNLCFFKYLEQDGVLIGKYKGWGTREPKDIGSSIPKQASSKNRVEMEASVATIVDSFVDYFSAVSDSLRFNSKKESGSGKKKDIYSSHVYDDGDPCVNGKIRSADVHYKCGVEVIIFQILLPFFIFLLQSNSNANSKYLIVNDDIYEMMMIYQ